MQKGFKSKLSNQYGSQEGAPIAYECSKNGFHISPESGIFEILRPDNSPCSPGELGRLVVTSFLSYGTPLIRYDIGDLGSMTNNLCLCGREMPLLDNIQGRVDDMFFTKDKGVITRVDSAFKSMPNAIIATQVIQKSLNTFEVKIIPDKNIFKDDYSKVLVDNLRDYIGDSAEIRIELVSEIKRTSGGKIRAMVNESEDVHNEVLGFWNQK